MQQIDSTAAKPIVAQPKPRRATQAPTQFDWRTNRKGERIQVFKRHRDGNRSGRLQFVREVRLLKRRERTRVRIMDRLAAENPFLVELIKKHGEQPTCGFQAFLGFASLLERAAPGGKAATYQAYVRRYFDLPDPEVEVPQDAAA